MLQVRLFHYIYHAKAQTIMSQSHMEITLTLRMIE